MWIVFYFRTKWNMFKWYFQLHGLFCIYNYIYIPLTPCICIHINVRMYHIRLSINAYIHANACSLQLHVHTYRHSCHGFILIHTSSYAPVNSFWRNWPWPYTSKCVLTLFIELLPCFCYTIYSMMLVISFYFELSLKHFIMKL